MLRNNTNNHKRSNEHHFQDITKPLPNLNRNVLRACRCTQSDSRAVFDTSKSVPTLIATQHDAEHSPQTPPNEQRGIQTVHGGDVQQNRISTGLHDRLLQGAGIYPKALQGMYGHVCASICLRAASPAHLRREDPVQTDRVRSAFVASTDGYRLERWRRCMWVVGWILVGGYSRD